MFKKPGVIQGYRHWKALVNLHRVLKSKPPPIVLQEKKVEMVPAWAALCRRKMITPKEKAEIF